MADRYIVYGVDGLLRVWPYEEDSNDMVADAQEIAKLNIKILCKISELNTAMGK